MAAQIQATQEPHINTLNQWLEAWGRPFGSDDGSQAAEEEGGANHHSGNGLMSLGQMDSLDIANAATAQTLFLEGMIKHHQGAVTMADAQIKDGQHPDAVRFAQNIVTGHKREITTLQDLLAER